MGHNGLPAEYHQAHGALVPEGTEAARQPQPVGRADRRRDVPVHFHTRPVVRRRVKRGHQQVEVELKRAPHANALNDRRDILML